MFPGSENKEIYLPCRVFNLCTLETEKQDPELFAQGKRTLDYALARHDINSLYFIYEMSGMGLVLANMGRAGEMARVITGQIGSANAEQEHCYYDDNGRTPQYENRLTAREGINAMSAQRLGNVSAALQLALLQSSGGKPAADPVIRLFPALPQGWNARFKLYARGGFLIESSCEGGRPGRALVTSVLGGRLLVRNVWGKCTATPGGGKPVLFEGETIDLETVPGGVIELCPAAL
jgi:hypothetical protein